MTRKPKTSGSAGAAKLVKPEEPKPVAPLASTRRASAAARLLGAKGSVPSAKPTPSTSGEVILHADSTGPEPAPSRSNDVTMGPRHFRRADTWR